MQSERWMIIKICCLMCCKCVCMSIDGRTCLSPAKFSGFSVKDDFVSHTQIPIVYIQYVSISSLSLHLPFYLPPLPVYSCVRVGRGVLLLD